MTKALLTLVALAAVPLQAQDAEHWDLSAPRVAVRFNAPLLRDMGVRLTPSGRPVRDGYAAHEFGVEGRLKGFAPGSLFETVESGELRLTSGPTLLFRRGTVSLAGATLRPGPEPATWVMAGADGTVLFTADHQHNTVERKAQRLHLFNLDLKVSDSLAARLGAPALAGQAVGVLEIDLATHIPAASVELVPNACDDWGKPDNDVGLVGMGSVQQQARDATSGLVVIAPSASLKNLGVHAAAWYTKFSGNFPPYNNDQHPFLVWNMYRVSNGALQQIGASGLKHAFLTINSNCICNPQNSHILGQGCEDVYGTGNNNNSSDIGPRSEVNPLTGEWQRCGSLFDKNCDGFQDSVPPFSGVSDKRRLVVTDSDLQVPGATYYFEAWYVVRDDVNIFNTQGNRAVTPSLSGATWTFGLGPYTVGPAIDAWVNPTNPGPNADSQRLSTGLGNVTLAVRATDVGNGRWRYDYALMNHDFAARIRSFSVPVPAGSVITNVGFHDADRNPLTDWTVVVNPDANITWRVRALGGPRVNAQLDWGMLDSFTFEIDAAPSSVQGVATSLTTAEPPVQELGIAILGPTR